MHNRLEPKAPPNMSSLQKSMGSNNQLVELREQCTRHLQKINLLTLELKTIRQENETLKSLQSGPPDYMLEQE